MHHRLPIILVAGFFGSGKSSLLHHHLIEHQGGYQAIIVETLGSTNHDATALRGLIGAQRRVYDVVLPMPEAIAGVEELLRSLAKSGRFQRVWVELSGITSLTAWARQFRVLADQPEGFSRFGYLHQSVLVVDALDCLRSLVIPAGLRRPGPWVDFHHGQIESATVLVLNKCDQVDDAQREQCRRFLRAINPVALIVETDFGEVPPEVWDRPGSMPQADFATEKRLRIEQREQSDAASNGPSSQPFPEIDCRVVRFWRAFHPERLWHWFNENHPGLLRVKGIIWLATRNLLVGGVSRTLWQNGCGAAGLWWAALPEEQWPETAERRAEIQATWHEPYGDRRQELTLIGTRSSLDSIGESLLACLLTDEEVAAGPQEWVKWNDPFPEWSLGEEPA